MNVTDCWQDTGRNHMIALLKKLAPAEGFTLTPLDGVKLMRWDRPLPRSPVLYEPSIVVICSGRKIGYLGRQVFHYNPQHFLVLSVPLPFESETIASAEEPLLGISMRIDIGILSELIMMLEHDPKRRAVTNSHGIVSTPLDLKLSNAVLRLLQALDSASDTLILGQAILREIHYRVLTGSQGAAIRALLSQQNHVARINKALQRIHMDFAETLDVSGLAAETGMSPAAFHASFKAVTATSPMQYLKTTRLHKARLLMIQDGLSAALASARVGYESPSQFSREFKRLFGKTPVEDVSAMRKSLITTPHEYASPYVTVQQ
ncbi:MAG TPA: AraC family transcriptional regulator [Methylophilaceae bacterium]|nr:AraC family transcriptional regulator [Methylophilaceae bacterium]